MKLSFRASSMQRCFVCPGSAQLQHGIPESHSDDAKEGTLLHQYDAEPKLDRSFLTPEHRDLLKLSSDLDAVIFQRVQAQFGISPDERFEEQREKELLITGPNFEISGHCDLWRYYPSSKLTVIIDRKYGRRVVTPASANLQLMTYGVGSANDRECENIVVAIEQPRLSYSERITLAAYTKDDIETARSYLFSIVNACLREDAPLVATEDGCKYCRAKVICSKYAEAFQPLSLPGQSLGWSRTKILEQIHGLTPEKIVGLLNAVSFSDMIKDEVRDVAREMAFEERLPGYELGKPGTLREIADPKRAMSLLELRGILTKDEILDCSKIFIGKIEERVREKKKLPGKKANELVEETIGSVIERSEKRPALIKKKNVGLNLQDATTVE